MEHPDYRNNLELLLEAFPRQRIVDIKEVARYTGKSREFVKSHLMSDCRSISIASLARRMCGGIK